MNYKTKALAERFHGYRDTELVFEPRTVEETKGTRYVILQEREVSYRFYLHQHPYVQQLAQRLIRKGTPGLQAADTEYAADNAALPGSLQVALDRNLGLTIPGGSRIALLAKVQATSGGVAIELEADIEVKTADAIRGTLPDGLKATLVDGMTGTPAAGSVFEPAANSKAVVVGDTKSG